MKKSLCDRRLDDINVSPIRVKSSETTPVKPRRKTIRRNQGADVHTTACSTPNQLQSSSFNCSMNSPSSSFPYSQEDYPDVVWDYTSPKLPKGSKRREIKITVDEFLKNLSQHQVPECNTQKSHYITLLEKWMTKQNTPVCIKKPSNNARRNKKRSRRVIEEIKEFMESIRVKNEEKSEENKQNSEAEENLVEAENNKLLNCSLNKKSFLQGDSNENDSTEELWGEADNSFIIKATQQLDMSYPPLNDICDNNVEIVSTIPETVENNPNEPKCVDLHANKNTEKNSFNAILDSDYHAQILLTQIISCEWESGSDDDWDKGFIAEDDLLSLIPDEVLDGTDSNSSENFSTQENITVKSLNVGSGKNNNETERSSENTSKKDLFDSLKPDSNTSKAIETGQLMNADYDKRKENSEDGSGEISFSCHELETFCQTAGTSETEIFNFDDENFGDESILCKPEVLSWMDEVENKLTQSQKCTPEEIEKKKDEAIQRRKRNRSRTKVS